MKLRNFIIGAVSAVAALVACEQENTNLGTPDISLSTSEMTFETAGGEQNLTINATRDWKVTTDADWVVVSPESGEASASDQTVTVTVLENTGLDRTADLKFTIGMKSKYLTVNQAGPGGSADALIVYSNNFDKTKAEKGSNGWATYLDSFDGWMNATGSGSETVTYGFDRMTARTNSGNGSAGSYSDYVESGASGMNYLWFGSGAPYFAVKNITLPEGKTDYTLSFGTERYLYGEEDNTFNWDEFKVYVSTDGNTWVRPSFEFAGGALPNGRWDLASTTFTVPAGTTSLYVYFTSTLPSAYAIDDLKLVQASAAGTALDFANGESFVVGDNTTGGGNTGGGTTVPESKGKKTVEEFIAAADTQNYYELTGTVSGFNATYCSFDLTDASGTIYVYSVLEDSKAEWSSKISNGGTITIYGKYAYYEAKSQHEIVQAHIVSFTAGTVETPTDITNVTVAEFLAKEVSDTWYRLSGTVGGSINTTYGNFDLTDETGTVYVYGISNWSEYSSKFAVGDKVTIVGNRYIYTSSDGSTTKDEVKNAYIESWTAGSGSGEVVTPPAGDAGEYDPQGITWTLGTNAYDNTSASNNCQTGTVNGVAVSNLLKIGTSSKVGDATLHVPAGTAKIGFYCVAWKNKTAQVKFSINGTEITTIEPAANTGATGNAPYTSITVSDSDYFEVTMPSTDAADVKVETLDPANGRALFIGLKAIE